MLSPPALPYERPREPEEILRADARPANAWLTSRVGGDSEALSKAVRNALLITPAVVRA